MKWYLTQGVIGEPEIDIREDDEDPTLGYSILRELARDPRSGLQEVAPGVWMPKDSDARDLPLL